MRRWEWPDYLLAMLWAIILLWGVALWASIASAQDGLDLPVAPPVYPQPVKPRDSSTATPATVPSVPQPDPPGDDPRDTPPPVFYGEEIDLEGDTLVYVIDCSGSMGPRSSFTSPGTTIPGRLDKAKSQLRSSVAGLSDNLKFDLLAYGPMRWSFGGDPQPANRPNKRRASAWIGALRAAGGTPTGAAMVEAFRLWPECAHYVLLTDGAPSDGVSVARTTIRQANPGGTVDVFGIEATGEFRAFCQGVAADSGGRYVDVP